MRRLGKLIKNIFVQRYNIDLARTALTRRPYEGYENILILVSTEDEAKSKDKDEAQSSGQLDVEPLHQEGESTTMPKNGPSAKKEAEDVVSEEKVAEEKDEGKSDEDI